MANSAYFKLLISVIILFSNVSAVSSKTKQDISPETFAKLLQIVAAKQHVFDNRNILDTPETGTHWKPLAPFQTNLWQQQQQPQPQTFVRRENTSMKRSKFPRHIEMNRKRPPIRNDQKMRHEQLRKKYKMQDHHYHQKQRNGPNIPIDLLHQLRLLVQATLKQNNETSKNDKNQHHHKNMTRVTPTDNTILFSNKSEPKQPTPKYEKIDTSDENHTHSISHISKSTQETLTSPNLSSPTTTLDSIINHQVSFPLLNVITTATTEEITNDSNKIENAHQNNDTINGYLTTNYDNFTTQPFIKDEIMKGSWNQTIATSATIFDSWNQWNSRNTSNMTVSSKDIVKFESEVDKKPHRIAEEIKRDIGSKWTTHAAGLGPRSGFISNKKLSTISNNTDLKDWTIEDVVESKNTTRKNKKSKKVRKIEEILKYTDSSIELTSTNGTVEDNFNETRWSEDGHRKSRHGETIFKETLHDDVLTEAYMEYFATSYISVITVCVAFILLGNIVVYTFYRRHKITNDVEWRRQGSLSDQSELY